MPSLCLFLLLLAITNSSSAENVPPPPHRYFNDHAQVIPTHVANLLDQVLAEFERETSNQIVVVIYENLPADAELDQFAQDAYRSWKVGQVGRDNGVILFVFLKDRKVRSNTDANSKNGCPTEPLSTSLRKKSLRGFKPATLAEASKPLSTAS